MNTNFQCPKCHKLFSQTYYNNIHKIHCKGPTNHYTTQIINDTKNNINYLNNYDQNNSPNNHTIYNRNANTNTNRKINPNINKNENKNNKIILPQHKLQREQTQKPTSFRPQSITYFKNHNLGNNNYSQLYQKNSKNSPTTISSSSIIPTCKCYKCGKTIPLKEKKDHDLSHKIEQEEKDRLHAQRLQVEENLFENLSPEQIEEQRKIEEHIKREQRQRQNNNNYINNYNYINNDFNININDAESYDDENDYDDDDDNDDDMNNNGQNMGNIIRINHNGFPNIIIRRTNIVNNNNGMNNFESGMGMPNFFQNFFNRNMDDMDNEFFNRPSSSNFRRIIIPMGGMGEMDSHNNLNDIIERMLHYSRENPTDEAILSELPENQIDDIKKLDNDKKNCVICMEDFKNGDISTNLPCLHMFHTNCIQTWLNTQNTCPICKFELTEENINNINRRR